MLDFETDIVFQGAIILALARKRAGHFRKLNKSPLNHAGRVPFSLRMIGTESKTVTR